jgi:hypothetical protein
MNDWSTKQTLIKPEISFIWDVAESIIVNSPLPSPIITGHFNSSGQFQSNFTFKLPVLNFKVDVPINYTLTSILPKVATAFTVFVLNDYQVNSQLYKPALNFQASLVATITNQTWVFNTITTAHSRYTNYDFNSFFKIGTKNFGINSNGGIYELTGSNDFVGESNEAYIQAQVDLPVSTFGEQTLKACSDAILYGRCDGEIEIQVVLDEQEARTGYVIPFDSRQGMHRNRVRIPKGLRGNVWQFKIKNRNGSHFDINAFEIFIKTLQRLKW